MVLYLGIFCLLFAVLPKRTFSEAENRYLQSRPAFSWDKLLSGEFGQTAEKYLSDQFILRDTWISLKAKAELLLQKNDHHGVYFGREGYLLQKPSQQEKEQVGRNIAAVNEFAKQVNGRIYFMLAPVSAQILRDKLPRYAAPQIIEPGEVRSQMSKEITFIDPTAVLESQRQENIYYKTDHHWTTRGAYFAYQEAAKIMGVTALPQDAYTVKQVSDNFYGTLYSQSGYPCQPDTIQLFVPQKKQQYTVAYADKHKISDSVYACEHLQKKDQYALFLDGNHALIKITTPNQAGKKLLIIKDSYANALVPFLIPHFSEIHVLDLRYFHHQVKDYFEEKGLEEIFFVYNTITFAAETSLRKLR